MRSYSEHENQHFENELEMHTSSKYHEESSYGLRSGSTAHLVLRLNRVVHIRTKVASSSK